MIRCGNKNNAQKKERRNEMYNKSIKRLFITMPRKVFDDLKEVDLLPNIDTWVTNLIMEEIEHKREEMKNGQRKD